MMGGTDDALRPTIKLTPVIKEMVRTQVCFENIKLLVDKISIVRLSVVEDPLKNEAFRLLLTDGEVSIQCKAPVFCKDNRLIEGIQLWSSVAATSLSSPAMFVRVPSFC